MIGSVANSGRYATKKNSNFDLTPSPWYSRFYCHLLLFYRFSLLPLFFLLSLSATVVEDTLSLNATEQMLLNRRDVHTSLLHLRWRQYKIYLQKYIWHISSYMAKYIQHFLRRKDVYSAYMYIFFHGEV